MQINRNNYEAFFLDYWEGNLGIQAREDLSLFLEMNPDLQREFYEYDEVKDFCLVPDKSACFDAKNHLKKEIFKACGSVNHENYETFIIASLEGDLSKAEAKDFNGFISLNPSIKKVIEQYRTTYLNPPENIIFKDKDLLKRKTVFLSQRAITQWSWAAAAILIFGVAIFYVILSDQSTIVTNQISQNSQPVINKLGHEIKSNYKLPEPEINNLSGSIDNNYSDIKPDQNGDDRLVKTNNSQKTNHPDIVKSVESKLEVVKSDRLQNDVHPLIAIASSENLFLNNKQKIIIEYREEFSMIFNDLLLRDVLKNDTENPITRKSAMGRVFANLGNKIINRNNPDEVNNSLVSQIATRGKETLSGFSSFLPVYRTVENEGKKETYLAFSESFSIYKSKTTDDYKPEKTKSNR